jgi:hypothetical protein
MLDPAIISRIEDLLTQAYAEAICLDFHDVREQAVGNAIEDALLALREVSDDA